MAKKKSSGPSSSFRQSSYTVLGQGEAYISEFAPPRRAMKAQDDPGAFERAQARLRPQVDAVIKEVASLEPMRRLDEVVVEIRLSERFLAKSYRPNNLLTTVGLTVRGMGVWDQPITRARAKQRRIAEADNLDGSTASSLSIYASGTDEAVWRLRQAVDRGFCGAAVQDEISRIESIRLPSAEDRSCGTGSNTDGAFAIEIVLYDWGQRSRDEAVSRIRAIARKGGASAEDFIVRSYTDGPTFIAAVVKQEAMREVQQLNFLRLARPLPRIALTRTSVGLGLTAPACPVVSSPPAWIAVFDAGFNDALPHFSGYVIAKDLTSMPATEQGISHGTAVASAALYGHIAPGSTLPPPECGVLAYRVLPDARASLELYGAIDAIEDQVRKLPPSVKVINLSFGPVGPIDARRPPSRFTYAIDRLTFETKKLFFTAVGNWGARVGMDGIQTPSDSVNNVSVGAYEIDPATGNRRVASYSCRGPGRSGGACKPDLLAFGGSAAVPFYVLDAQPGKIDGTMGTSFASPLAASLAAQVLARVQAPISEQACRALVINGARPLEGEAASAMGWGILSGSPEEILACSANRVSVLYTGVLSPRMSWKLPFLLPEGFDPGGNVSLEWTICYAPEVQYNALSEYTLAGIDLQLRPHSNRYRFSAPMRVGSTKQQVRNLDIAVDASEVKDLLSMGWKQAAEPLADSKRALDEQERRAAGKWETVVRGAASKRRDSILNPALTVAIIGRGLWDVEDSSLQAVYSAVLTVSAPKYAGDLYVDVVTKYDRLKPLALQSRAEVVARLGNIKT